MGEDLFLKQDNTNETRKDMFEGKYMKILNNRNTSGDRRKGLARVFEPSLHAREGKIN